MTTTKNEQEDGMIIDTACKRLDIKVHALAYLYSKGNRNATASVTLDRWAFKVDLSLWYVGVTLIVKRDPQR